MKTILIIEDECQTRNIFLRSLEFEGFCAYGASNGSEGVQLARHYRPHLVVCDIMMPDMDGYTVLSQLRSSSETVGIPLIFLTAKVTMADLRQGMELGADDYLTKPCTVEQFLSAIATRLQRQDDLLKLYGRSPQQYPDPKVSPSTSASSIFPHCPKLVQVFRFIETSYHKPINLNDVAQAAGYSPAYLTHLVQKQTGHTVKQWIIKQRMAKACQLLQTTQETIRQVAERSGYPDAGYFTRQFRQIHGISPLSWRQQFLSPSPE
ncbi:MULTISPECIES: response regulator [unclassified Roseofilum]|uniref:response regulator transcription factor n=1 Tax=unclassified Roseofilum TaxID=2620099 RepID=UPI000E809890|nr:MULTISPECIES: response regulator [unclassified Roseofilum]MBP0009874.1 response regulator [Roseofilum sp. Belize Diploria]MBP0034406.1 response regulator [Roseofilum sp. Belize BBD 4]HBQ97835.1 DNA-binding response regulator [Cyanobacteria bacterium UBA11691]